MPDARILIVDDEPANLNLLRQILKGEHALSFAKSGADALATVAKQPPDLILLDVMMPNMDGYEVCRRLKADPRYRDIPVIFCTAKADESDESTGFELGAVDYITKPVRVAVVKARVRTHLALAQQKEALAKAAEQLHDELIQSRLQTLQMLGRAAEFKDNETGLHVIRMSHYAQALAKATDWPDEAADLLLSAAPMHDVGKIGIPDAILRKPGRLDAEEMAMMRTHAEIGARIIGAQQPGSRLFDLAASIALTHHEKWNGTGYPQGLRGTEIPIEGRIVAIADVFDALTTRRPYKEPWPVERALALFHVERGAHFDPELVSAFLDIMPEILAIREQWQEH
ncbi:two-component system response regulator [Thiocapsa imhoffii]|uniref:Two-component system response regulator n=1 Tax=Thiocapsa imhoffii TaxID=382777 RepID=A0A9X0WKF8_9GAMM|nr:HD domain-containing phosphohydrolase [Thiocapsa imhoffii]MBK1646396.1 two-component system response regulator [Thiocapsa imhoffii]